MQDGPMAPCIHISRRTKSTVSDSQRVPLQLSHVVHVLLKVLLSGIHVPTSRATILDASIAKVGGSFSRPRKDRLQARIRVSAQTGQRECMHARRRKRCDEPFTKRRWLGRSTLQASCERRWLDCSVWTHVRRVVMANGCQPRGAGGEERLAHPATGAEQQQAAAAKTKLHAPLLRQRNGGYLAVSWTVSPNNNAAWPSCRLARAAIIITLLTAMAEPRQARVCCDRRRKVPPARIG